SSWQWKQATPSPNKADLENAFAAQYTGTAAPYLNHKLLFFGGDRFSNNGDTNIGLWFFHNPVSTSGKNTAADGSCPVQSGCGFTGLHTAGNISLGGSQGKGCNPNPAPATNICTPGDIFILSSFTGGGAEPTIKVFDWVGPRQADQELPGLAQLLPERLSPAAAPDPADAGLHRQPLRRRPRERRRRLRDRERPGTDSLALVVPGSSERVTAERNRHQRALRGR